MNNQPEQIEIDNLSNEQISYSTMGQVPHPTDIHKRELLNELTERQRFILMLRDLDVPYYEIADGIGLDRKTINREIKKIKKIVQEMSLLE